MSLILKDRHFQGSMLQNRFGYWGYFLLIGLIIGLGIFSAIRTGDAGVILTIVICLTIWLLLLRSMLSRLPRWRSWIGVLQFAASWLVFPLFKIIHQAMPRSMDAGLLTIDRGLFSIGLTERLLNWESLWLTEVMSLCYLSFYLLILVPVVVYAFRRHGVASQGFFYGLMLMYLGGFIGYLLVPASGPYLAFPDIFPYPPQGDVLTSLLVRLVAQGGTGMDVFPSLHCGISIYVLGYACMRGRYLSVLLLSPLVVGLILATLYLRYHYGVDLIAGMLLAFSVLTWLHRRGFSNSAIQTRKSSQ